MFTPEAWVRLPDPFPSWSKNPDEGARHDSRMRSDDPTPESDQAEFRHIGRLSRQVRRPALNDNRSCANVNTRR
jgi:hypothetical protein